MNIKKNLDIKNNFRIWRILINQNNKILIEARDTTKKEVFFSCYNLLDGEVVLKDFQFDEKFWLGIESFYNDTIFFHSFPKPDMPNHKEIISFDVNEKIIKWHNQELAFLFCFENIIYAYKQGFEGKFYYSVDFKTGEIISQLNDNEFQIINEKYKSEEEIKYLSYSFPEEIEKLGNINFPKDLNENISGHIEAINYDHKFLLTSFNKELFPGSFTNIFKIYELENQKEIFTKVLDAGIDKLALDTFFVFKNFLFLIVEKNNLEIYKLES